MDDTILRLADASLGKGYLSRENLQRYRERFDAQVLELNEEVFQGFSIVEVLQAEQAHKQFKLDRMPSKPVGYRKIIAVEAEFRGSPVMKCLFEMGQQWLMQQSIDSVYTSVWEDGTSNRYARFLEESGFVRVKDLPQHWKEDSLKRKFICPVCGEPPCICNAGLYRLDIHIP